MAASILWIWIFNPHEGILNAVLAKCGVSGPAWLQNEYWSKPALILMGLIGIFQIFTQAYVRTQGGPADSTLCHAY